MIPIPYNRKYSYQDNLADPVMISDCILLSALQGNKDLQNNHWYRTLLLKHFLYRSFEAVPNRLPSDLVSHLSVSAFHYSMHPILLCRYHIFWLHLQKDSCRYLISVVIYTMLPMSSYIRWYWYQLHLCLMLPVLHCICQAVPVLLLSILLYLFSVLISVLLQIDFDTVVYFLLLC